MTDPVDDERLDSWKAIADYLHRDVQTVRRWEKTLHLPVRRVGRGHSVFAYVSEIETWLQSETAAETRFPASTPERQPSGDPPARRRSHLWWVAAAGALSIAIIGWRVLPRAAADALQFDVTELAVAPGCRPSAITFRSGPMKSPNRARPSSTPSTNSRRRSSASMGSMRPARRAG